MSGTGVIAEGVLFSDGRCITHWLGTRPKTETWDNLGIDDLMYIVTHAGTADTRLVWDTPLPAPRAPELSQSEWDFIREAILMENPLVSRARRQELCEKISSVTRDSCKEATSPT